MSSIKKFKKWKDVPKYIQIAFEENRWRAKHPSSPKADFWTKVEWVNYICAVGYFHGLDKNKHLKV